ncbi:MAG: thiamine-phosphate kinase [Burkholderiaceae bacterium]|jgi:thiamine-monophosphate kinase|nr:thiamine-phosphate kinase [Burkholderiaceae bacterium]
MNEFELIDRYFRRAAPAGGIVRQGVGDDCALLDCGETLLAMSTDMLLEGRHFAAGVDPASLGHKALAVNLSDLAAAGASPRAFQLALALPRADEAWLGAFCRGLFALADEHACELAGGDTTRVPRLAAAVDPIDGPLTICITVVGDLPRPAARTRGGARVGDDLWVSGTLGDARAALAVRCGELDAVAPDQVEFARKMDWPQPRVALGAALRGIATAAIDVSDGLVGDLGHVLKRSRVGAVLEWERVPRSTALRRLPVGWQQRCALAGGDDYELLFSADPARRAAVEAAGAASAVEVTRIGRIVDRGDGLRIRDANGSEVQMPWRAFDHFG